MKNTVIAILAVVTLASEVRAQQPAAVEALDGVDPVLLVQGKGSRSTPRRALSSGSLRILKTDTRRRC